MASDIIQPSALGSQSFRHAYSLRLAYVAGAMYKGIASEELVIAMGRAGLIGFLGTGGLPIERVEEAIGRIRQGLRDGHRYGMNLLCTPSRPEREESLVDLYLRRSIERIEAAAYTGITRALARYRLKGLRLDPQGQLVAPHRIMAKVSRPEVAEAFLRPVPSRLVAALKDSGEISEEEARLGQFLPVADDLCVEADSGGHTDRGVAYALFPAVLKLRDRVVQEQRYGAPIHVGAAGGLGTPESVAAAFVLGADFVVTGSINQCTVEAGTSPAVKDLLQGLNVQDVAIAPAGDMFEMGAKVQVAKRGLLFPARASKLYELYMRHNGWEEIDPKTRQQIEDKYFRRSFEDVWSEAAEYQKRTRGIAASDAARDPKRKMALVFRWYFAHATRLAMSGDTEQPSDYQIHCGPALGAFNQWVVGSEIESWRNRRCADLAERLMQGAAAVLSARLSQMTRQVLHAR